MALLANGDILVETDRNATGFDGPQNGAIWRVNGIGMAALIVNDTGRLRGMVPLADGRVFASDYLNHYVGIFDPRSGTFAPLAGERGVPGNSIGTGTAAHFTTPYGAVPLANGDMLLADYDNHCLRRVTLAGAVTTFAGVCGTLGYQDGPVATALFNRPQGLAIDSRSRIFVTDTDNFRVRLIVNGQVSTLAGNGNADFADGEPLASSFYGLEGIDVATDGSMLYIADGDRGRGLPFHRVRRLPLAYLGM
jgi:hypothetical protein